MVCDAEREVSIAGVMGGAESAITEETVDILIESANWDPSSIRSATRALGIRTDASYRFERGADPNGVIDALNRAADLVLQTAGGVLLKGAVDVYPKKVRPRIITLRTRRVNEILGTSLSAPDIRSCLRPLGIVPGGGRGDAIQFEVPTFRVDIEREIDLIEEVARVYGYDRIEARNVTPVLLHGESHVRQFGPYLPWSLEI